MSDVKITILGSGTCVPSLKRSSCSVLVETGGSKLVFDMGTGTMRRLLESGVTIGEISHIFFSHFHPDHTGELVNFRKGAGDTTGSGLQPPWDLWIFMKS